MNKVWRQSREREREEERREERSQLGEKWEEKDNQPGQSAANVPGGQD